MSRLCTHLNEVTKTDSFCDSVQREYQMYTCDNDRVHEKWMTTINYNDICAYRNYVSQMADNGGTKNYQSLSHISNVLLHHHMAMLFQRGFLIKNFLLTKNRLLLRKNTIKSVRGVKEITRVSSSATHIPITKELLLSMKSGTC